MHIFFIINGSIDAVVIVLGDLNRLPGDQSRIGEQVIILAADFITYLDRIDRRLCAFFGSVL